MIYWFTTQFTNLPKSNVVSKHFAALNGKV